MENVVYERDYAELHKKQQKENELSNQIFDRAINGQFFSEYQATMKALPKIINPESKANYEYVLSLCDKKAKDWGGKVKGEVRYDKWDAVIHLALPFIEFGGPEELEEMKQIASRADSVTISQTENGEVELYIFFYYFDDLTGNESADEIKNRLIMDDPELVSLLEKTALKERIFDALSELVEMYSEETGRSREELIDAISQMNFHDPEQLKKEMMELFGITEWPDDM